MMVKATLKDLWTCWRLWVVGAGLLTLGTVHLAVIAVLLAGGTHMWAGIYGAAVSLHLIGELLVENAGR